MMTRKNFRELAEALRETNASHETVKAVADACKASNRDFNYQTFYAACGPKCPRCGGCIPNDLHPGEYPGALSRLDNETYICSACGQDEALFQFTRRGVRLPSIDEPVFA